MDEKDLDPQMLKNLDMLLVMDALEEEDNWDSIEKLEEEEATEDPEAES